MTAQERKVDVCLRWVASGNEAERRLLEEKAGELLREVSGAETAPVSVRQRVEDLLTLVGVPCNLLGYDYLVEAIVLVAENPDIRHKITGELYPALAKKFDTPFGRIERGIRVAITYAFDNADTDVLTSVFGNTVSKHKGCATNSQFISTLAREVRRQEAQ